MSRKDDPETTSWKNQGRGDTKQSLEISLAETRKNVIPENPWKNRKYVEQRALENLLKTCVPLYGGTLKK